MIICCGEALIDMLPREATTGEPAFSPKAGGAVFNTAIALGRLGAPVGFFSGISTDLFGRILTETLNESRVDTSLAVTSDRPTTLAFVTLKDGQASYAFYDENTAGRMVTPGDVPDLPGATEALFFGAISLIAEPCGSAYEALCMAQAPNRVIMLDPNVRPSFVTDEESYRARITRMIGAADIIKVSDEDLTWLAPGAAPEDAAEALLDQGPSVVLLTAGEMGATALTRRGRVSVPGRPVQVVDTVGAGDTFNAGVLAALHLHGVLEKPALRTIGEDTLRHALTLGVRAAAVTVSRAGANPPWANEL